MNREGEGLVRVWKRQLLSRLHGQDREVWREDADMARNGGRDGTQKDGKGKEFTLTEIYSSYSSVQPRGEWGLSSSQHKTIWANLIVR